ncbi:MAG: UDP-3-O-acyl-N-acetylglucosamine deacetylase [Proteobacteria bacterium]|nr:UDP-3-O-acyl-N-acetylglucosamine deacetylase [Pseudomonadota bacterium]
MLLTRFQTTLQHSVSFTGKGLHSGRMVRMTIKPAAADSGILFQRMDTPSSSPIRALAREVSSTALSTTIGGGAESVSTVEHLLAALAGLGITNALVQLDGPEVPIMDGSSSAFVRRFMSAGLRELSVPAKALRLRRPLLVKEGDRVLRLQPSERQRIKCSIEFKAQIIGDQSIDYMASLAEFLTIADARTFCQLGDIQAMREQGLALGGGLENAIVVNDQGIMNEEGLRAPDEFVRHKLLDLIGDFSLLGAPLLADIYAYKCGHAMHANAVKQLIAEPEFYLEEFYPDFGDSAASAALSISMTKSGLASYA